MKLPWQCPYCSVQCIITNDNFSLGDHTFDDGNKHDSRVELRTQSIVCPNPKCREIELTAALRTYKNTGVAGSQHRSYGTTLRKWKLMPQSAAVTFPDYVPQGIRSDYEEACLIKDLSPKASATLSRRCLQGMIRDFHSVTAPNLFQEIEAIRTKIDPLTWDAIDSVRQLGNIGAHMQKDIGVIVDVDSEEAEQLIGLIETLIREWYIARHEREERMKAIKASADQKRNATRS